MPMGSLRMLMFYTWQKHQPRGPAPGVGTGDDCFRTSTQCTHLSHLPVFTILHACGCPSSNLVMSGLGCSLEGLRALQELRLNSCGLPVAPRGLSACSTLTRLSLSSNEFNDGFGPSLGGLSALQVR